MITTRREVNIENGSTALKSRTVKRIAPEEKYVSISPEVEVKPFKETASQTGGASFTAEKAQEMRITPKMDLSDLMPVIKSDETAEESEQKDTQKLSSKAKIMLCVYLATALILALIVLATGLAITGTSKEVAALENEVKTQSALLADSEAMLSHLSDDLTITGSATEMGMVKTEDATEVELIKISDKTSYEERTNAFDRFCDFISGIIGG